MISRTRMHKRRGRIGVAAGVGGHASETLMLARTTLGHGALTHLADLFASRAARLQAAAAPEPSSSSSSPPATCPDRRR